MVGKWRRIGVNRARVGAALVAGWVLAAYVVPYTALADVTAWYGSFLFWVVFAAAAIGIIVVWLTRPWSRHQEQSFHAPKRTV